MKSFQKVLVAIIVISVLSFTGIGVAQGEISKEELEQQIAKLLAQIESLRQQLTAEEGEVEVWCHTFEKNIKYGDEGLEVLQTALEKEGFVIDEEEIKDNA